MNETEYQGYPIVDKDDYVTGYITRSDLKTGLGKLMYFYIYLFIYLNFFFFFFLKKFFFFIKLICHNWYYIFNIFIIIIIERNLLVNDNSICRFGDLKNVGSSTNNLSNSRDHEVRNVDFRPFFDAVSIFIYLLIYISFNE